MNIINRKMKFLSKLFFTTLYISSFTFGGGFVILTFMKKKFVDELAWLQEQEMLDYAAIAQAAPGANAVNAAILVGFHTCGIVGMITAVLGTIIPPMIIITIVSFFYEAFSTNVYIALLLQGMQAGVAAIILEVVYSLGKTVFTKPTLWSVIICLFTFIATFFFSLNVVIVIVTVILIGVIRVLLPQETNTPSNPS